VTLKRYGKVTDRKTRSKYIFPNHELVVLAAYLAGAQKSSADTEDIAVKANELAPGRFTWRKYKEQIDIETVRKRLWDATKADKGAYLIGSEKAGWRLTKAGFDFARRKMRSGTAKGVAKQRKSKNEGASQTREIKRMMQEDAFKKFGNGMHDAITKSDVERFFRIDDYVTGTSRAAKIERFKIIASSNKSLSRAIEFLSGFVKES
jgi:hypothetical protein